MQLYDAFVRRPLRSWRSCERGTSAIEFAIVAPAFLLLLLGIISYGTVFGTYNGVQQLAAESARAAVAGLDATERDQLARAYVDRAVGDYPFLDPSRLVISTSNFGPQDATFQVSARYDMSNSFVFRIGEMLPLPSPIIVRTAAIQRGGY